MALDDAGDQPLEARRLVPPELPVLQVQVVHHLGDGAECAVLLQSEALEQCFERAAVALVRVVRLERVEADGSLPSLAEAKASFRIDEALDQPGARNTVDMHVRPRYPGLFHRHLLSFSAADVSSLEPGECSLRRLASRSAEMVECRDVAQTALESRDLRH